MKLERLKELAGIPLTEDDYGRDQGAREERQGSEFVETENKALKKKIRDFYNKSAGDEKAVEMAAKKYGVTVAHAKKLLDESLMEAGSAVAMSKKPKSGQAFGASDQAPPEEYTPAQLSRLADAMWYAQLAGIDEKKVFSLAPTKMKGEWNYSKWKYVAE